MAENREIKWRLVWHRVYQLEVKYEGRWYGTDRLSSSPRDLTDSDYSEIDDCVYSIAKYGNTSGYSRPIYG